MNTYASNVIAVLGQLPFEKLPNIYVMDTSGGDLIVALPAPTLDDAVIGVINAGAGVVTVTGTLFNGSSHALSEQYQTTFFMADADAGVWRIQSEHVNAGEAADFSLWLPDAPPETAGALDDEFDTPGAGVPAGWTKFDPADRLMVSVEGGGLHLVAAPLGGIENNPNYVLAETALLDNHTYNVFDHQPDVPRYISVTLVADTDESFISITMEVNGTDPNGDPVSRTFDVSPPVGSVAAFNRAFATITSIVTSGGSGITGDETISVGIHNIAPALCGIYKEIPPLDEDGSWIIKLCGGGQIDGDVAFAGLAFFEDAEDPTKFIYCFGEHWYADVQTVQYDKWFGPRARVENTDAHSGYLRIRRNGDGYFMDFSAQGLSFATSSEFTELSLGITPKHVGLVVDNTDLVSMGATFAFFRYKSSDVTLTGVLEGARVKAFYA